MDMIDRVHPELRDVLRQLPAFRLPGDLEKARNNPMPPLKPSERVSIRDEVIKGAAGQNMMIRIYEPAAGLAGEGPRPALLWIHGGGYVMGHPGYDDNLCQLFAETAGCIVFSPDYRLAPEHPFPAGLEDCYAALSWIHESAGPFGIDTSRVAIAGASAGGGLTAALALLARDRGGPRICFQMPLYPMIDDRNVSPSSHEIDHPAVWNRENNIAAWEMYLGHLGKTAVPAYAAPIRAENLAGLPPTYTCVGQLDPFRDETIEYAARLAQAGVDVEFHLYPGGYHGYEHAAPGAEISIRTKNEYVQALARALKQDVAASSNFRS
jgi:acetyl esterase/lipase